VTGRRAGGKRGTAVDARHPRHSRLRRADHAEFSIRNVLTERIARINDAFITDSSRHESMDSMDGSDS